MTGWGERGSVGPAGKPSPKPSLVPSTTSGLCKMPPPHSGWGKVAVRGHHSVKSEKRSQPSVPLLTATGLFNYSVGERTLSARLISVVCMCVWAGGAPNTPTSCNWPCFWLSAHLQVFGLITLTATNHRFQSQGEVLNPSLQCHRGGR